MSNNGLQEGPKHGGAHVTTHGPHNYLHNSQIHPARQGKHGYFGIECLEESGEGIQDGGHAVASDVSAEAGFAECSPDKFADDDSGVVLSQESVLTLSGNSMTSNEWIKSRLENGGRVCIMRPCEAGEMGGALLGLTPDNNSSDSTVLTVVNPDEILAKPGVHNKLNGRNTVRRTNVKTGGINIVNLSSSLMDVHSSQETHVLLSDNSGKQGLSEAERACLEEIEKGSQLSPEEKELLENSRREFQALEFHSLNSDKSNTLMTPMELELMPERGREFEESVGPKEDLSLRPMTPLVFNKIAKKDKKIPKLLRANTRNPPTSQQQITLSSINGSNVLTINNELDPTCLNLSPNELGNGALLHTIDANQTIDDQVTDLSTNSLTTVELDDTSSSTHILINTPQGQQIFQLNTAELNKAAFQGGLVGADTTGNILHSGAVNNITIEDGYLVIPVNQEGNEGDEEEEEMAVPSFLDEENNDEEEIGELQEGNQPTRAWMCEAEGCNKIFTKMSKLKVHLMTHTNDRPFRCTMPGCDWAFTTAYKLKRHEESHQKKKDYPCDFPDCGRRFTTVYNLNTHRKLHDRPCTQECPECGVGFPTMRKLDLHLKNHIGAQKTYKCPIEGCDKFFFSPHCMGSHTRVHQENRDLTCHFEGCNKVFDKACRLKQHIRSHTGEKPYICTMNGCGWAFSTASKLKRHQRKHTNDRRWQCPVPSCGKAFMRAEHLKGHLVTHSGQRPFLCHVEGCGARFTAKSSMYVHIKKHQEGSKKGVQFPCPLDGCEVIFTTKSGLRSHIAKHYQDALAQANTGDLNSLIPILSPEDIQEGLESLLASQNASETSTASQALINTNVSPVAQPLNLTMQGTSMEVQAPEVGGEHVTSLVQQSGTNLVSPGTCIINPGTSVINTETSIINPSSNIISTGLSYDSAETGVLDTVPITEPNKDVTNVTTSSLVAQLILSSSLASNAAHNLTTTTSTTPNALNTGPDEPIFAPDPPTLYQLTGNRGVRHGGGSARTEYQGTIIDRAKRRRRQKHTDTGQTNTVESPDSQSSTCSMDTASSSYDGSEMLSSSAITFRDPDTGIIYVQTQLLQDDPPDPPVRYEDQDLNPQPAPLPTDLPANIFQDGDNDESSSFTGSTINLQDLA